MSPIASLHLTIYKYFLYKYLYFSHLSPHIHNWCKGVNVKWSSIQVLFFHLSNVSGIEIFVFYFSTSMNFIDLLRTKLQENPKWKLKLLCMNYGRAPNLTKISVWTLSYRKITASKSSFIIWNQHCTGEVKLVINQIFLLSALQIENNIANVILL